MVDTDGRPLELHAHSAAIQDRDGAVPLLQASRNPFPVIEHAFADSAYASDRVATATHISIEIVRKHPDQIGFAVHPRRWVVMAALAFLAKLAADLRRAAWGKPNETSPHASTAASVPWPTSSPASPRSATSSPASC